MDVEHNVVVTGAPAAPDGLPSRLPIEQLQKDEKQWSLYIQALRNMQDHKVKPSELSYFEICGIHGLPYRPWDNVGPTPGASATNGYCTHANTLFPTWHRAYLALFEQALVTTAIAIASNDYKNHPDAASWLYAAQTLRLPYWDWLREDDEKAHLPPDEVLDIKQTQITVVGPGNPIPIDNPLLFYKFVGGKEQEQHDANSQYPTTVRHPDALRTGEPATPELGTLKLEMRKIFKANQIRDQTLKMFDRALNWDLFSTKQYIRRTGGSTNSIEAAHDSVHFACGGVGREVGTSKSMLDPGHMSIIARAGFDPIFWLHHTNVDRLMALWQAIHPQEWVSQSSSARGTFNIPPDQEKAGGKRNEFEGFHKVDENTKLTPFWNSRDSFYTSHSKEMQEWDKLNYTYPEFKGVSASSQVRRLEIIQKLKDIYHEDFPISTLKLADEARRSAADNQLAFTTGAGAEDADATAANVAEDFAPIAANIAEQAVAPRTADNYDWFVRIRSVPGLLGMPYAVTVFLGDPPASPREWEVAPNCVGAHYELVNTYREQCENCMRNVSVGTEGFVSLAKGLKAVGMNLGSHSEAEIEEYLKENIQWTVQLLDCEVLGPDRYPSLEVSVMTLPLFGSGDALPTHRNLTAGRPGGRQEA